MRSAFVVGLARVLAVAAILQPAFAWLESFGHSHLICWEHGELIDGREPGSDGAATGWRAGELSGKHEHCPGVLSQRSRRVALAKEFSVQPAPTFKGIAWAPGEPPGRSIALYRLAPKASPPV